MTSETRFRIIAVLTALATSLCAGYAASESASHALASPEGFAGIENVEQRIALVP